MIRSMTGYARARSETEGYAAEVELRSVNHRYQDVRIKASGVLAGYEKQIRDRVSSVVARGKVDVTMRLEPKSESMYAIEVDRPLIEDFVAAARRTASELGVEGDVTLSDLIAFSPAFKIREREPDDGESLWEALRPALEEALERHRRMRAEEGRQLMMDVEARVGALTSVVSQIEALSGAGRERKRQDLLARIQELSQGIVEPSALAMEVSRLVERADISEEITRFRSHLALWEATLAGGSPCGKKLDFIVQEMNREANTIGSKCQDASISEHVITLKAELERIREQIQNVE